MISIHEITKNRILLVLMYLCTTYAFTGQIGIIHTAYVILRYSMVMIVVIAGLFSVNRLNKAGYKISHKEFIWLVYVFYLCVSSILVTNNVKGTIMQVFWLLSSILFAWLFTLVEFNTLLWVFLDGQLVILFMQLITLAVFPGICYAHHDSGIVFQGSFYHKNALALQMVFGLIVCLCVFLKRKDMKLSHIQLIKLLVCAISSFVLLMATGSGTARTCIFTICITYLFCFILKRKINIVVVMSIFSALFIGFVFSQNTFIGEILENVLHRDATLTGRLRIWNIVLKIVKGRPFFGYGFNSFWEYNPELAEKALNMGAHNGFFELLLQIGYIGTFFLILLLIKLGNSMKQSLKHPSVETVFDYLFITMLLTYAIGERILVPFVYTTVILIYIIFKYIKRNECHDKT